MAKRKVLVTGAAGFIGFHLCRRLLADGHEVVGLDNMSAYYDVRLKQDRLALLEESEGFFFEKVDLADSLALEKVFSKHPIGRIANLAAQPGVRHSLKDPASYVQSNLVGFSNLVECARHAEVEHLVFASSSSVYGANRTLPFSVSHNVDHPLSIYAASKKANELIAHSYAHLYRIPCTGLRFFTVYGPWGRPDMALFKFTEQILRGEPITVFNHGKMSRDFTYVDDIAESLVRLLDRPATPDPKWNGEHPNAATSDAPYRIYNIGGNQPIPLLDFICTLEEVLGQSAVLELEPAGAEEMLNTCADTTSLAKAIGITPTTPLRFGIERFIEWYLPYYQKG